MLGNRVQSTSEIDNLSDLRKSVLTSSKVRFQATPSERWTKMGPLKFTVKREAGDFVVWEAKLVYETSPTSVPDGGATLMLLGVALAGIESLRRATAKQSL